MIRRWASGFEAGVLGEAVGLFGLGGVKEAVLNELEGVVHDNEVNNFYYRTIRL